MSSRDGIDGVRSKQSTEDTTIQRRTVIASIPIISLAGCLAGGSPDHTIECRGDCDVIEDVSVENHGFGHSDITVRFHDYFTGWVSVERSAKGDGKSRKVEQSRIETFEFQRYTTRNEDVVSVTVKHYPES